MPQHLMILPTMDCPASCSYCFGPSKYTAPMTIGTVERIAEWINIIAQENSLDIVFHGGEPLSIGFDYYKSALPVLSGALSGRTVNIGMQSNLWLLTDDLCSLFQDYNLRAIGTSLDGPEMINDAQRGRGYFRKTMAGIEKAQHHDLSIGCICTFTSKSAGSAQQVYGFFAENQLDFNIHAALPILENGKSVLKSSGSSSALTPDLYKKILSELLARYLDDPGGIRINTLDAMCRSVSTKRSGLCTFQDCLGYYLAVTPEGWIYPCQRFAGKPFFRLGHLRDMPSLQTLAKAPAWRMLQHRQEKIKDQCGDCPYFDFCRGGCPYSVLAARGGLWISDACDPYCPAYRAIYKNITDRALSDVFSPENIDAVVRTGTTSKGIMQRGKLLKIMSGMLNF